MKIALGADSYGFDLKEAVKAYLISQGHEVQDAGIETGDSPTPYYQTASVVAQLVTTQQVDRGILCCGTGMGMAIIANKFPGVYAAVCENTHAAEKSRSINNSNVLTLGGMFTTPMLAHDIVNTWLSTEFAEGWDPTIQAWLENSMKDIFELETQQFTKVVPKG
jgi:ribose 5-phosphate isomerase B